MSNPYWEGHGQSHGHISPSNPWGWSPYPPPRGRGRGRVRRARGWASAAHHNRVLVNKNGGIEAVPEGAGHKREETLHVDDNSSLTSISTALATSTLTDPDGMKPPAVTMQPQQPKRHEENIAPTAKKPIITHEGVQYCVTDNGRTLDRITPLASGPSTPRTILLNNGKVRFIRTIGGKHLFRADKYAEKRLEKERRSRLCPRFNPTGFCHYGDTCKYYHDPQKVAICKEWLLKGKCPRADNCDLSHDPTPERTPACIYFSRGNCTNSECRYAHVKVDPNADICRDFATFGYCKKGADCVERHVNECPDYANTGACPKSNCHLPHVARAGLLRRLAGIQNTPTQPAGGLSNLSSDKDGNADEEEIEDVVSDDVEDAPFLQATQSEFPNAFRQQEDFIGFE